MCSPDEIQIITLTTTVSGTLKNDLAFIVRGRVLVVGEHMSSPYENMPVRLLMYVGLLYEKWIKMMGEDRFIYRSSLYKIPTPEFVVFYNGIVKKPEKEILYLSSAFESTPDRNLGRLELEVPVYNINKGMNKALFSKSSKLAQYAEFIAKLREFNELYRNYTQAVRAAVNHCIANDVMADFLREQGGKIVSILSVEYDLEVAKRIYAEEQIEDRMVNVAKELLAIGLSKEHISRATGLSLDEITALESDLRDGR